jgi:hypothetical protein
MDTLLLAVVHSKDHVALYSIISPFCYKPQLKPHIASNSSKRLNEAIDPRIRGERLRISTRKPPVSSFYQYKAQYQIITNSSHFRFVQIPSYSSLANHSLIWNNNFKNGNRPRINKEKATNLTSAKAVGFYIYHWQY